MAEEKKPKRPTHAEFVKQLIERVLTAAKAKASEAEQNAFILKLCADIFTFLASLQTKPDDQADHFTWDSGELLRDFWDEILAFKLRPSEPQHLLRLMVTMISEGVISDLITAPYLAECKIHYLLVGATQYDDASISATLTQIGEVYLKFASRVRTPGSALKQIGESIPGFQEPIDEPVTGKETKEDEGIKWFCSLGFVVGNLTVLIMIPGMKEGGASLVRPFAVFVKGEDDPDDIKLILGQFLAAMQSVLDKSK